MFSFFKRKKPTTIPPEIKKYSYTNQPATEGSDNLEDYVPLLREALTKLETKDSNISLEHINALLQYKFKLPTLVTDHLRFNPLFINDMVLCIDTVKYTKSTNKLLFVLKDKTFGYDLSIEVDPETLTEVFNPFQLDLPKKRGATNKC